MVYAGFPAELVSLLRCDRDGAPLQMATTAGAPDRLVGERLTCSSCGQEVAIDENGIVRMLKEERLDNESAHEHRLRDDGAKEEERLAFQDPRTHASEVKPTIRALGSGSRGAGGVLELGCGTGRYTLPLAERFGSVLAVDFSIEEMRLLAARLPAGSRVGLVQADVVRFTVAPRAFDACLSTLVSNLPSREHRRAMLRLAAGALCEEGRLVFSVHHFDLRRHLAQAPTRGRYHEGGIYRELFRAEQIAAEVREYFSRVRARPIQVGLPMVSRLGIHPMAGSWAAERIPVLRNLGRLVLVEAAHPMRAA